MIVRGSIVSIISLPTFHSGRGRFLCCLGPAGIVDWNHRWIIAAGVLAQVGDFTNDTEAGIAPEMALDKSDIMDSGTNSGNLACDRYR